MSHFIRPKENDDTLLHCLLGTVHQGITVIDKDFNIVLVNETARLLLDIPMHVLDRNPTLEDLIRFDAERGDYGEGDPEAMVRGRMTKARLREEHDFERQRPDGRIIRIQGTPMANGGFVALYTDVTERRRQENELLEARASAEKRLADRTKEIQAGRDLLFNAVNAVRDGLAIADPEGRIVVTNEKMREIFPVGPGETLIGKRVTDTIRSVFPDEPELRFEELAESGDLWSERQFPDGKWYKIERSRTSDGGIIAVYTDITTYKNQQSTLQSHTDELVKLLRQEQELTEMQREFVSMASHEFRTPLAIIDSNAQRLKRQAAKLNPEKVTERADRVRDAVERMQYLITQFLNFSQAQSVGMSVELSRQPLRALVKSTARQYVHMCKSHKIHIDVDALPQRADIDPKLLEQCITNLLSNAAKYSPEKNNIFITGTVEDDAAVISIRDEGVGIPEDEIPKVFNRYFRASTSSGIAGTGIGLNLTQMIVQSHNGTIEVQSRVGQGTTIVIRLPIGNGDSWNDANEALQLLQAS